MNLFSCHRKRKKSEVNKMEDRVVSDGVVHLKKYLANDDAMSEVRTNSDCTGRTRNEGKEQSEQAM
jgi:hypothetical protein